MTTPIHENEDPMGVAGTVLPEVPRAGAKPAGLPKPKNKQSSLLLKKMCVRLSLAPIRTCRSLHSCVFCGLGIVLGDRYRDRGYAARAHETCFLACNREFNK